MTDRDDSLSDDVIQQAEETIAQADELVEDYPTPTEITGKVVGFINRREVIINVGSADGVKVGMQFAILVPGGVPIWSEGDPPMGIEPVLLGRIGVAKAVVKVVRVDGDHLSIGRTFMTIKGRPERDLRNPFGRPGLSAGASVFEHWAVQEATPDRIVTFDVPKSQTIRGDVDLTVQ
jgi:hypothetical protein